MGIWKRMKEVVDTILDQDPAARNRFEVITTYSGLHALWHHRIAHALYKRKWYYISRLISQASRLITGIEIHPGAQIGRRFFIDHGMGVVIGETCIIGDGVTLYQGVTLGGTGKEKGKRHPTIGDNVLIASGSKVLGNISVGEHAKIGANSVVLHDVPAYSTVVGIPGRVVVQNGKKVKRDWNQCNLPDPVEDEICKLKKQLQTIEEQIKQIKESQTYDHKNL